MAVAVELPSFEDVADLPGEDRPVGLPGERETMLQYEERMGLKRAHIYCSLCRGCRHSRMLAAVYIVGTERHGESWCLNCGTESTED